MKVKYASSEELLREYTYNTDGTVKNMKDYTGSGSNYILKEYTYDALNRVTAMKATKNGSASQILESYAYTYDKNSNILTETLVNNTPSTGMEKVDETRTHTYDNLGRLLKTVYTDRVNTADSKTVSYTYDDAGNRRTRSVGGETTAYTYNGLYQLTKAVTTGTNGEISNKTYTYDAKGNELTETDSITNASLIYEYDTESQLLIATLKNGSTVVATQENWYNGNGQRIGKTEVTAKNTSSPVTDTSRYFYDGTTVLYTTDDTGSLTTKNFLGLEDNVIATRRYSGDYADQNYFYLKDIRGCVTSIVDASMNGVVSYEYDEFGITTVNGNQDFENQICYTGGIYDELTGLYYLNARYCDPEPGRFLSEDTYRGETNDFATWHLYVYCANNPVKYTDPSGHWVQSFTMDVSVGCIFTMGASWGVAIDSKNNFCAVYTKTFGVQITAPNVSAMVMYTAYPNSNNVKSLSGREITFGGSVDILFFSASAGFSVNLEGGGIGTEVSVGGGKNISYVPTKLAVGVSYAKTYCGKTHNHSKWMRAKKGKKVVEKIRGKKVTIKKQKNSIDMITPKVKITINRKKKVTIKRK